MQEHSVTQQKLAEIAEVTQPTVAHYLQGNIPNAIILYRFAKFFTCSMESFLGDDTGKAIITVHQEEIARQSRTIKSIQVNLHNAMAANTALQESMEIISLDAPPKKKPK